MHVFLSYPKAGRTWLRFMVNAYLARLHDFKVDNIFQVERRLPGVGRHIEWTHLTAAMLMRRPYYAMGPIELSKADALPWLLLVRNRYATLASAYYQARDRIKVFDGTPSAFLRDPRFGAIKLVTFLNLWETLRGLVARSAVFSYEAILADPVAQLPRVLGALDIEVRPDLVQATVDEAALENMKRLSVTRAYAGTPLAPRDPRNPDSFKIRTGGDDSYTSLFTAEDIAFIDTVMDSVITRPDGDYYQFTRAPAPASSDAAHTARRSA